ncbi:MAG: sulfatase [Phycisphaerales bacterium]|nr:MAG: sulfatase [Phycisphaerales bacterium]
MNDPKQTRRDLLKAIGLGVAALATPAFGNSEDSRSSSAIKPNFIIIFTDDQGYQDVGCFGSPSIKTPHLDRMADEGVRFTSFYAQTVCGPSRAALMTGCYPLRVATRNNQVDIHPYLHTKEVTIAEVLKDTGYATACFGKWDLAGHTQAGFDYNLLPTKQGFDYFFGTPTSNDSVVNLLRNETIIEKKADMNTLTRRYTDEALAFIRANKDKPFFVYIPHTMAHTKLGASAQFRGKSKRGLYGDVIEEIDWNVGRILDAVKELGLDDKTYVIFMSDNGPWAIKKDHGGSAAPLRGAKTSTWEGGLRVPCIMWAPGRIPPGTVCDEIASTMDMLPTVARLAGGKVPTDRVIDGHDITALIHGGQGAASPAKVFFYYQHTHLQAVRSGKWKLHLPRPANPPWTPNWARHIDEEDVFDIKKPILFDLKNDIGERLDVAAKHPELVAWLLELAEWARLDIGDYNRAGRNARFFDHQPRRPDAAKWAAGRE